MSAIDDVAAERQRQIEEVGAAAFLLNANDADAERFIATCYPEHPPQISEF